MSRKVYDLNNPSHVEEIMRLLEEDDDSDPISNDDFGEESDVASEDEVEERDGDTEMEQEGETDEDEDDAGTSFFGGKR